MNDDLIRVLSPVIVIFLLLVIFSVVLLVNWPSDAEYKLIEQHTAEYQKCIAKLPRDKDCTLTGFVFTITPKKG